MLIRDAVIGDVPALTELYNHYVLTSDATFDVEPFTLAQRTEWFSHYSVDGPHRLLVGDVSGVIVGYAASSMFRPKAGYRTSVETSVYLAAGQGGRGYGRALYDALFAVLRTEDVHRAYAGIALPNAASVALHEAVGFTAIGTFTEVGFKRGRWIDVSWFELAI